MSECNLVPRSEGPPRSAPLRATPPPRAFHAFVYSLVGSILFTGSHKLNASRERRGGLAFSCTVLEYIAEDNMVMMMMRPTRQHPLPPWTSHSAGACFINTSSAYDFCAGAVCWWLVRTWEIMFEWMRLDRSARFLNGKTD